MLKRLLSALNMNFRRAELPSQVVRPELFLQCWKSKHTEKVHELSHCSNSTNIDKVSEVKVYCLSKHILDAKLGCI